MWEIGNLCHVNYLWYKLQSHTRIPLYVVCWLFVVLQRHIFSVKLPFEANSTVPVVTTFEQIGNVYVIIIIVIIIIVIIVHYITLPINKLHYVNEL